MRAGLGSAFSKGETFLRDIKIGHGKNAARILFFPMSNFSDFNETGLRN